MNSNEDSELRQAFRALGDESRQKAPSFAQLTSSEALRGARGRLRRRRGAFLAAAVLIPAIMVMRARSENAFDYDRFTALTGIDLGQVTWQAPSDFLLDVPGQDLLRRVPVLEIHLPALAPDSARPPDSNTTKRRSNS